MRTGELQVWCPNSGLWAWTGIQVDTDDWRPDVFEGRELGCDICQKRHRCTADQVRVPSWGRSPGAA